MQWPVYIGVVLNKARLRMTSILILEKILTGSLPSLISRFCFKKIRRSVLAHAMASINTRVWTGVDLGIWLKCERSVRTKGRLKKNRKGGNLDNHSLSLAVLALAVEEAIKDRESKMTSANPSGFLEVHEYVVSHDTTQTHCSSLYISPSFVKAVSCSRTRFVSVEKLVFNMNTEELQALIMTAARRCNGLENLFIKNLRTMNVGLSTGLSFV